MEHRLHGDECLHDLIPVHALGVNAQPFSVFTSGKNFCRISLYSQIHCKLIFLFWHHFSNFFYSIPTLALLVFFAWALTFAQFHPVAHCLRPNFDQKKAENFGLFHFKIESPNVKRSPQNYKVSKCKFIHKNSRQLWHWNGILRNSLAMQSCLTSLQPIAVRAANAFSARPFPIWPAKRRVLQRAVCHLAAFW